MDKMLYIATSGAKQSLIGMGVKANNLANANTTGFKADIAQARSMQAFGEGMPTRVFALQERAGSNTTAGGIANTGRDLDIALSTNGWLTVLDDAGNEAYTKAGSLSMTEQGMLVDKEGRQVVGNGGPIILPVPVEKVSFSKDGTIEVRPQGAPANFLEQVDQLKIVDATGHQVEKGNDGLFRAKGDALLEPSEQVSITTGALENSNVNPVHEMVDMISHQRQFELQVKLMKTAEENDQRADSLLRMV